MKYTYRIRADEFCETDDGLPRIGYGVDIYDRDGCIRSIKNIFVDKNKAEDFVSCCNRLQLSPTHIMEVIEDISSGY